MPYPSDCSIQQYAVSLRKGSECVEANVDIQVQFDEPFVCTQILKLLGLALSKEALDSNALVILRSAHTLVRNLTETVKVSGKLRKMILYAVRTNETQAPLQLFISVQPSNTSVVNAHGPPKFCHRHCSLGLYQLQQAICILLLTAAIYVSNDEVNMDSVISSALLEKHTMLSTVTPGHVACRSPRQSPVIPQVALFEAASTPATTAVSRDWKSRLAKVLNRGASRQHEQLIEVVDEVCRDLQSRCDDIERPLREEQSMTGELRDQVQDLNVKYEETENKVQHQVLALDGLKAEKSRLICQLQATEERLQTATEVSNGLQETLEGVRLKAELSEQAAREDERKRELKFFTTLAAQTELDEQRASELASQGLQITSLNHEMNLMRSQAAEQAEEIARLEQAGVKALHDVERAKKLAKSKEAELALLNSNREAMQAEIEILQLKVRG